MTNYDHYAAYFNGEWVTFDDLKFGPNDRGFMLADVVFDIARTFDGKPFRFQDHIDRLYKSLKYIRIDPGLTPEEMLALCEEGVTRNLVHKGEAGDFAVNPFVTRGDYIGGTPRVAIAVRPVNWASFAKYYVEGAHGVVVKSRSLPSDVMEPKVKHHSRLNFVLGELEARDVDPEGLPILMDQDGNLTEGTGWSLFLVKDGVLKTPTDKHILQSVARKVVMEVAEGLGIPVSKEDMQPYDLYTADEVFFSRTSPRITPVSRVDTRPVGDEFPGPITKQLLAAHSELVGLDIVDQALHHAGLKE